MRIQELYRFLSERIPASLSCDWDNDGLMCCPDPEAEVRRVLIALDITEAVVHMAVREGYDLIVSHHPLIFSPLRALDPKDHVAKKVITLLRAGISAMSFHTRLDAVEGGVNDLLAARVGLCDAIPFGNGDETIGRIGRLEEPLSLSAFAARVKEVLGADSVLYSGDREVSRVALLGGGGSSDVEAARRAGADTYLTGELKHNQLTDAPECGMNLVAAGHFYTEDLVCRRLGELIALADPAIALRIVSSNPVKCI